MPIYEYRCDACGFQKEYLQRLNDAPHTDCPQCGERAFNKMLSVVGFQFKGTGWYATDFKNNGTKPAANKDRSAESSAKESSTTDAACGAGGCPACS